MGLLSSGGGIGGLLGKIGKGAQTLSNNPNWNAAVTYGSTQDPMAAARVRTGMQEAAALEERRKQEAEREKRRAELEAMQMQALKAAQERETYTRSMLQAAANNGMQGFQSPEQQADLQARIAAYGDPSIAQAGGLLQPQQKPGPLPSSYQEYLLAQQDPGYAAVLQQQGASGGSPYYSPVMTAAGVMTYDHRTGRMVPAEGGGGVMKTTDDPNVRASVAGAVEGAKVTGEASGVRAKNAPENNMTLRELDAISADGGLLDQSTGSTFGALRDRAAAGFGVSTEGAEAIARLKPIADRVLKLVPRFEGPQSDKDTISYREAAGQLADPTIPAATRKAAAKEIARLMRERAGQFQEVGGPLMQVVPGSSPAQGGGAVPATPRKRYNPVTGEFE